MDDPAVMDEVECLCELQEDVSAAVLPPVEVAAALVVKRVEQVPRHLLHHQQHGVSLKDEGLELGLRFYNHTAASAQASSHVKPQSINPKYKTLKA